MASSDDAMAHSVLSGGEIRQALPESATSTVVPGPPGGDLGAGPDVEPLADPFDVPFGGAFLDAEAPGDLAVAQPVRDQGRDLKLPGSEHVVHGLRGGPPRWASGLAQVVQDGA